MADRVVYFIQAEDGGPVKIGVATSPATRLANLQVGSISKLVIRSIIETDDAPALERKLHAQFAAAAIRGEWFHCTWEMGALHGCREDPAETKAALDGLAMYEAGFVAAASMLGRPDLISPALRTIRTELATRQ